MKNYKKAKCCSTCRHNVDYDRNMYCSELGSKWEDLEPVDPDYVCDEWEEVSG